MGSVGDGFVAPAQDLLALDDRARMNFPGRPSGNWSWRLPSGALDDALAQRVRDLTGIYGRLTS